MTRYTHRDRRAQRAVGRAFYAVVWLVGGLTVLALGLPFPLVGIVVVVALLVLGAAYIAWSDRLLAAYSSDLRAALEGGAAGGFARAETTTPVAADGETRERSSASPHARRRGLRTTPGDGDPPRGPGSDPDHV